MIKETLKKGAVVAAATVSAVGLAACGGADGSRSQGGSNTPQSAPNPDNNQSPNTQQTSPGATNTVNLCDVVPQPAYTDFLNQVSGGQVTTPKCETEVNNPDELVQNGFSYFDTSHAWIHDLNNPSNEGMVSIGPDVVLGHSRMEQHIQFNKGRTPENGGAAVVTVAGADEAIYIQSDNLLYATYGRNIIAVLADPQTDPGVAESADIQLAEAVVQAAS